MRFDGSAVLRKILDHPEIFPIGNKIDEMARKVVVAQMKIVTEIGGLKDLCSALGADNFKQVIDGISDVEAKSIVGKIDKENKEAKTAGGPVQRILLVELATGLSEPRTKAIKERVVKGGAKKPSSSAGKAIGSKSTAATRIKT